MFRSRMAATLPAKALRLILPLLAALFCLGMLPSTASAQTCQSPSGQAWDGGVWYKFCPITADSLNASQAFAISSGGTQTAATLPYTPIYTGSVLQFQQQFNDGSLDINDFMTASQVAQVSGCTASFDMTPILALAVAAVSVNTSDYTTGHGRIKVHHGCYVYNSNQDMHATVILDGESSGNAAGGSTIFSFPTLSGGPAFTFENSGTVQCSASGSAASSAGITLNNITIIGPGGAIDATGTVNAILACVPFTLNDVNIRKFPGDGVKITSTNSIVAGGWHINRGNFLGNAGASRYGISLFGVNANTGQMIGTSITNWGGSAVRDPDAIGMNLFEGLTAESNGTSVLATANQAGASYLCLDPANCSTTTPTLSVTGTWLNGAFVAGVWTGGAFNSGLPAYSSSNTYISGSEYSATAAGARNMFTDDYSEGGDAPSDIQSSNWANGGNLLFGGSGVTPGSTATAVNNGDGNYIASQSGYGGITFQPSGALGIEAIVGGGGYANGDVIRSQNLASGTVTGNYRKHWIGSGCDLYDDWDNSGSTRTEVQTGDCTTFQFGRGTAQPNQIAFPEGLFLSQGQDNGNARWVGDCAGSTPSTIHAAGDICFNTSAAKVGDVLEWYATAAGTPATWKVAAYVGAGMISGGAQPTPTGTCGLGSGHGGTQVGDFTTTGTCTAQTIILTFAVTAPNGWNCSVKDVTTPTDTFNETAFTTTTCTLSGTAVIGDKVQYKADAY